MSWRIVHIHQSERIQLKLDNLLVKKAGEVFTIPLSDISMIVAEGGETVVTLRLLSALSQYNIVFIVCDNQHLPTGIYQTQYGNFRAHKRIQQQLTWNQQQKDRIWQKIIYYKINNQYNLQYLS